MYPPVPGVGRVLEEPLDLGYTVLQPGTNSTLQSIHVNHTLIPSLLLQLPLASMHYITTRLCGLSQANTTRSGESPCLLR
jgi:hypothetical protein